MGIGIAIIVMQMKMHETMAEAVGGLLAGALVSGVMLALFMAIV